ncbi:hypothetical protein VIBNISOn1_400006 [Vibrio nigripulchritudo SOn1]|uniref:Uncharacterized protein n=1 Tax=Vibrio nigripulchritudo SOn1 TaxID=1238450 RepID=A0AAV2VTU8_9VIBR|nr:hypothetical protein VIBNISOn1_400006 [Vibrio nigripulchritudo SOn1]
MITKTPEYFEVKEVELKITSTDNGSKS